ncbi:MAG: SIMPL domain-containing protein [Rhodobacteraceae bacterium]|nr:SIMPL domain-containing protein [Paracoccaceae bacterium]
MRILLPLLVAATLAGGAAAEDRATLTMTGEGRSAAAPDMATITLGVVAEADTARAAMDEASASVAALLAALTAAGIEGRDVQTSALTLNPLWTTYSPTPSKPEITGFTASNTVTVRVRALDGLGEVLDRVLDTGANSFNGLQFGLQDPQPAEDAARAAAVADARRKAELVAGAAGVRLGPIVSITEAGGMVPPQPMMRMDAAMGESVPVAAGELEIVKQVTIVWEIGG